MFVIANPEVRLTDAAIRSLARLMLGTKFVLDDAAVPTCNDDVPDEEAVTCAPPFTSA